MSVLAYTGLLKRLFFLVAGLLILSAYGYAETDPRMVVEVPADERGNMPPVQEAIQQALPLLWDRVIESSVRATVSDKTKATPFLLRVVPHAGGVQVTFNQQRVWQYLDQQQIGYLKEAPRLGLQIRMINQNDTEMPKTASALYAHAEKFASARGVIIDSNAPLLTLSWRWLGARQVHLSVSGNPALEPLSGMRELDKGDPLVQLQAWLEELLLKARDGSGSRDPETVVAQPSREVRDGGIELLLTIEQPATLPEQVVLEEALRQHDRVKSLIPVHLSAGSRQYRLLLMGENDNWLQTWFSRRGMQAYPTPEGWRVQ